jgi:hypothetical protein
MVFLALKSVVFHWRQAVALALGLVVASAVLTGALIMGDSVKYSLTRAATDRLGKVEVALGNGGRLFPADIAERLGESAGQVAPILALQGVVIAEGNGGEVFEIPGVQVLGVEERFWQFAEAAPAALAERQLYINGAAASRLEGRVPETLAVRIPRPSNLPREAPLVQEGESRTARIRGNVMGELSVRQLGNFGLAAEQRPKPTVFVRLEDLQTAAQVEGRANLFICGTRDPEQIESLTSQLAEILDPEDYGLEVRTMPDLQRVVVTSERVFLDPAIAQILQEMPGASPSLTYLVNSISAADAGETASTPYSFVEATVP